MHRLLTLVLAMGLWSAAPAHADVIDQVVAYVDGEPIFLSELRERARPRAGQALAEEDPVARRRALAAVYARALDAMVERALIAREAEARAIRVSDETLASAIERVRADSGLAEEAFWQAVRQQGRTREQYERELRLELLRMRVLQDVSDPIDAVTDAEVRREWKERTRDFSPVTMYRLSQVYLPLPEEVTPQRRDDARRRAREIHERLRAKEITFDRVMELEAGEHIGWIEQSELTEEVRRALEPVDEGSTTGVVESEHGFQIVMLHERDRTEPPALDERYELIRRELEQERRARAHDEALRRLRREAHVVRRLARPDSK